MRPRAIFVTAVVLLMGLAIADIGLAASSKRSGFDYGGFYANEDRAVYAQSVVMEPGDRLTVSPNLAAMAGTFASYDFYVVPGGDRFTLLDGEAPRALYFERVGTSLLGCCPNPWLAWERPADELARREGARPVATGPGIDVDMRELEWSVLDQPERVDLVYVIHYAEGVSGPSTPEERRAFEGRHGSSFGPGLHADPLSNAFPTVYPGSVVLAHPLLVWAMASLALVAVGALVAWVLEVRRARVDAEGPSSESLLRLYDAAGTYLASIRDVLVGSLLVLLAVALHVALVGEPEMEYFLLEYANIGSGAMTALSIALGAAYVAVVSAWVYVGVVVHRALARWRARRGAPPLDLATE